MVAVECQRKLKSYLKKKFLFVFEGIAKAGQPTGLNDIYTELFITEGDSGEVNKEHEVRLIETAPRKLAKDEIPINCKDIFKPIPGHDQPIKTILTTGVAGIGKTILTHKFTLDWAEGNANHDIHFIFPFTFRELNLVKEKEFSLVELLHHFFIEIKEAGICRFDQFQVVFILDGLDECRLPLDFQNNQICTDVTESTSVDMLLTNLIRGNLLPSAHIWITTRPAAANQIPAECVSMVMEVRGFTDPQKKEYFRKKFGDDKLASKVISHIKTSRSLHIMCAHREFVEHIVKEAMAKVDQDYAYSRQESLARVRRNTVNPSDILRLVKQPTGTSRSAVRAADYMDHAIQLLQKRSLKEHPYLIREEDLTTIADITGCSARLRPPSCRNVPNLERFRTANSECNNKKNSRLGAANIPFTRWLPPKYQDGFSLPIGWDSKKKIHNHFLPLVRKVSNRILNTSNEDLPSDPLYTHLVTIFGQWTDHDLTFTPHIPVIRSFNDGIDCGKTCDTKEPCFPILYPKDDRRILKHPEVKCMPFFRSAAACGSGNTGYLFGGRAVRQQINSLTAFIDSGQVYGSDAGLAKSLRDLTSDEGLLRVNPLYNDSGRELLPFTTMTDNICTNRARITGAKDAKEVPCFLAGDARVSENIALSSLHTLLLREHNRLARALAKLNPHWSGERLYQEARKIMGAYFQVITFRDYLRHIVGPKIIAKRLSTYPGYAENVDPTISNVFATAAYRFAHLAIQPSIFRLDENFKEHSRFGNVKLHTAFYTPWRVIFEGGLDPIIRGLVGQKAKLNTQDHMMNNDLRDRLFEFVDLALDLAALNLQRGRDHGLPGYNDWRKFCKLSQPKDLRELAKVLNNTDLAKDLLDLYGTPDNIDVFVGGVAEPFVQGGRVGELFACIISIQFQRIRQGDRLWWENGGVFTGAQRKSMTKASLARIICDNTGIVEVPQRPFEYRPRGSGYTKCEDIPGFDLSPWKEDVDGVMPPPGERDPPGPPGPRGPPGPPGYTPSVAFSVRLGEKYPKSNVPLVFREVIYNGQGAYDVKKGWFICAIPGVYEFEFRCTFHRISGNVDLLHNGKLVLHSYTTKQNDYVTASGSTLIQLKKGDKVYLVAKFSGNGLSTYSYFTGHLLFTA
ncbi:hypothetical protein NHX12_015177 [Muraenolepis orangiensis]|uniref:C1q domain-containing protein n=1 Tax=Muraenolepis orangiensis TaxID=630683 RepID=A0A9Q0I2R9_9TELE|nr:hypothetical protein NHX12_015177 [Muraenolepis orangiensis]